MHRQATSHSKKGVWDNAADNAKDPFTHWEDQNPVHTHKQTGDGDMTLTDN